jgi:hypothetical protein
MDRCRAYILRIFWRSLRPPQAAQDRQTIRESLVRTTIMINYNQIYESCMAEISRQVMHAASRILETGAANRLRRGPLCLFGRKAAGTRGGDRTAAPRPRAPANGCWSGSSQGEALEGLRLATDAIVQIESVARRRQRAVTTTASPSTTSVTPMPQALARRPV